MTYIVSYLSSDGKPAQQDFDLEDRDDVLAACRAKGLVVLDLKQKGTNSKKATARRGWEPFGVRPQVMAFFTRQMAELTSAGIPLIETLETLQQFCSSGRLQDVISSMVADISGGKSFGAALEAHPDVFDRIYVNTIKVGETSGHICEMLSRLADHQEKDAELRSKIKSALTYPTFILVFCMLLSYFMVAYLLPGFMPMFQSSGLDLHKYPLTELLIAVSKLCTTWADEVVVFFVTVALVMGYRHVVMTDWGRLHRDSLLFKLPVIGEFVQLSVHARVCETLSLLMDSGIPVNRAVEITSAACGNLLVEQALNQVRSKLESGKGLSNCLSDSSEAFPPLMVQMVAVGERSGDVPKMLNRISAYYSSQLDTSIKGFSSLVEPVLMLLIGGVVGIFVMGVFMPLMGVVGALQSKM